jgi:hypothetical protein
VVSPSMGVLLQTAYTLSPSSVFGFSLHGRDSGQVGFSLLVGVGSSAGEN